jgi:hypothetical protein
MHASVILLIIANSIVLVVVRMKERNKTRERKKGPDSEEAMADDKTSAGSGIIGDERARAHASDHNPSNKPSDMQQLQMHPADF